MMAKEESAFDRNRDLLRKAYKKLKASVYYDKTQAILRDKIVLWEQNAEDSIDELALKMVNGYWEEIINNCHIDFLAFPKKLCRDSHAKCNSNAFEEDDTLVLSNLSDEVTQIEEVQYFIDMDVEGYLLGVVWLLVIGYRLDEEIYEHSYGNRLCKNLIDEDSMDATFSPYLFEPYFHQYEGWRDRALEFARKSLMKSQDVIILTLDFKRFFYQLNITKEHLIEIIEELSGDEYNELTKPLTEFVWEVIRRYSDKLRQIDQSLVDNRNILPIGFAPSNILSNYGLKKFDDSLINGWNPVYYGRYVDDIIIVDKIEKNSNIYKSARDGSLKVGDAINYFLENCSAWKKNNSTCLDNLNNGLLVKDKEKRLYKINSVFVEFPGSEIYVQDNKIKIFYFNSAQSDALLTCFQKTLRYNRSEFRFLPEDEPMFQEDDYSEIYQLVEQEGPNKLRGVDSLSLDKFNLSKFLGKYMRISGLINDKKELLFERDIDKIFTPRVIVENYTTWEKVLEILVNNDKLNTFRIFVNRILSAIEKLTISDREGRTASDGNYIRLTLINHLIASVNRALSLTWGQEVEETARKIAASIEHGKFNLEPNKYTADEIIDMRRKYCISRMCNKYSMPVMIDGFITNGILNIDDKSKLNLTVFQEAIKGGYSYDFLDFVDETQENRVYRYYPYLVTMNDLAVYDILRMVYHGSIVSSKDRVDELKSLYAFLNYEADIIWNLPVWGKDFKSKDFRLSDRKEDTSGRPLAVRVGDKKFSTIKVAVGNTVLKDSDFEDVLRNKPNRTYQRYHEAVNLVNQAVRNKAQMLVLPEGYWPFEWLPILARTCAKNEMAVVTGVEHVKLKDDKGQDVICNLTAVILPYEEGNFKFSYIHFHAKNHFAPHERVAVESYRCKVLEGIQYELFDWNDFWFPVYCCYELTSISDRSLFQSYADSIIAVEWNKDVNYYSNIVESLSRDLHCYCIQVNTARYGDSRITQPSRTEEKDLLKVKGGRNPVVIVEKVDLKGLRDFQLKGNALQEKASSAQRYKPTPPDFDYDVVQDKILGRLWDNL